MWVHDIMDGSPRFLWLTGDPGSGKSAITASTARSYKNNGILWAQFFIDRDDSTTTNPALYFPSIARQPADHSPAVARAIHDILKKQPSLIDDISQDQAGKLFVDSLEVASSADHLKPVVIIIDGLETATVCLRDAAEILSKALVDLPRNVKVFISSRTEDDIRQPSSATFCDMSRVKHVHIDPSAE